MAKKKERQVVEIRSRHGRGERLCDLSREFGVSWNTIYAVIKGWTWRHVA